MLNQFVNLISDPLSLFIVFCAAICVCVWVLRIIPAYKATNKRLVDRLDKELGTVNRFQDLTRSTDEGDRIDGFLATIQEVIDHPDTDAELEDLNRRLTILAEDGTATRLPSWFERDHNLLRYAIEGFPLLGILGTILPLGFAINSADPAAGASDLTKAVGNFAAAIGTTIAGLIAAIIFGVINAAWEPSFDRLTAQTHRVDELIVAARKKVRLELQKGRHA